MKATLVRTSLTGIAGLTLAAASLFAATAHAADTISVVTFGGAYEAAAKKAFFEPFTAATGIGFSTESYDGGLAKLSAMEQAKNPTWDLIDLESNDAITGCDEGLLRKIDRKSLGNTSAFIPGSIMDCAVAAMVWSTVYAYDTTKLKTPPTTINDFFDLGIARRRREIRRCVQGPRHARRRRPRVQETRHDQAEHRLVGSRRATAPVALRRRRSHDAGLQRPH